MTLNWTQIKCIADREVKIDELQTLAATIREVGLINPITLIKLDPPAGDKLYEVIAGRRRFKAMVDVLNQGSFVEGVDFRVMPENCDTASISLVENFERKNLTLMEEIDIIRELISRSGLDEISKLLGRTKAWVALRANLGNLSPSWWKCMGENMNPTLKVGHYEIIARLTKEQQEELWDTHGGTYGRLGPVESFRRDIESRTMHKMSEVPFKHAMCKDCPQRSQAQKWLFADLQDQSDDRCLDDKCYKEKLQEHIDAEKTRIDTVNQAGASRIYLISESYGRHDNGVLGRYDYERIDHHKKLPKEPNAFIVEGDHAGIYCHIKVTNAGALEPKAEEEKKAKTMADRDAELLHKREKLAIEKLIKHFDNNGIYERPDMERMFKLTACLGVSSIDWTMRGLSGYSKVCAMSKKTLLEEYWQELLKNIKGNLYQDISGTLDQIDITRALNACDIVKLDWMNFMDSATDEIKEPKSWAALRAAEDKNNNKEQE